MNAMRIQGNKVNFYFMTEEKNALNKSHRWHQDEWSATHYGPIIIVAAIKDIRHMFYVQEKGSIKKTAKLPP